MGVRSAGEAGSDHARGHTPGEGVQRLAPGHTPGEGVPGLTPGHAPGGGGFGVTAPGEVGIEGHAPGGGGAWGGQVLGKAGPGSHSGSRPRGRGVPGLTPGHTPLKAGIQGHTRGKARSGVTFSGEVGFRVTSRGVGGQGHDRGGGDVPGSRSRHLWGEVGSLVVPQGDRPLLLVTPQSSTPQE